MNRKKLEDMDPEERKKIRQLLKEQMREDSSSHHAQAPSKESKRETVDFLYKKFEPDSEDYLLGKRIEKVGEEEPEENSVIEKPGAIFSEVIAKRADLDMQAKMREDPLYAIRKKEEEARRRLLENPIKMKQLQKKLDQQNESTKKKKKKKDKKHKSKKHGSSDSEDDSDDDIFKKYLAVLEQKKNKSNKAVPSGDTRGHSNHSPQRQSHKDRSESSSDRHKHKGDSSRNRDSDRHRDREERTDRHWGLVNRSHQATHRRRSRSRSRSRSPPKSQSRRSRSRSRSRSPPAHRKQKRRSPSPKRTPPKKKLSAEELEKRRQEMVSNAKAWDEMRAANVKRYYKEAEKEKEEMKKQGSSADFINPLMATHASQSSLQDRINRNKYNLQRTKADLDKNFAKH